jgi:hypothetical protein
LLEVEVVVEILLSDKLFEIDEQLQKIELYLHDKHMVMQEVMVADDDQLYTIDDELDLQMIDE